MTSTIWTNIDRRTDKSDAVMYGTASRVQSLKADTLLVRLLSCFIASKVLVLPSMKTWLLTNMFETYAMLHITTYYFILLHITTYYHYGTSEQPCQRIPLVQCLRQSSVQDWITAMPRFLNIRGQPRQTAACPEYSGPSCHGNLSSWPHLASPRRSTLANKSCKDNVQYCNACLQIAWSKAAANVPRRTHREL